jgi:thiopurine S-methyltransferase
MNDQVRVTVSMRVPPAVAFEVFTKEIDVWWKRGPQFRRFETNAGTIHFECTLGGRLLETLDGDSTCEAAYAAMSMDRDFWLARWREGRIAFHESTPNVFLTTYAALLGPPPRRIFVPLCGKARDLAYLASLGHEVIGVELSSIAAEAFFTESAVTPECAQRGPFASLTAGSVTILVGDVFDADATTLGHIDAVYDRAAIVALEPAVQERYARHIVSLLPPDGPILLVTFDYDTSKMKGPPFAVPPDRVQELFGARCNIEKLDSRDVGEERPSFRAAGAIETAFHLTVRA